MAHAVVIQVKIDPDSDREHRHSILNDFVLPEAKALPGFEKGIWMNDGAGTGTCVVVFDSELHAQKDRSTNSGRGPAHHRMRRSRSRSRGLVSDGA
jgi:hypothetical protein